MRIDRLVLKRYGKFTDANLEFSDTRPDLHIVFGLNEAGKSTALSAFSDVLYGIPSRSPLDFLHSYRDMRVGATISTNGQSFTYLRRKGRANTVLDTSGNHIRDGEAILREHVGNSGKRFFERMFGLDHSRLREGGESILDQRDDADATVFAASSGIHGIQSRVAQLEAEADKLWGVRRSKTRKYYEADDRRNSAAQRLREHEVRPAKWKEARGARDERKAALARAEEWSKAKRTEHARVIRIRRVAPNVRKLEEVARQIKELGAIPSLRNDAAEVLAKAEEAIRDAGRDVAVHRGELAVSEKQRDGLAWEPGILLRAKEIRDLGEQRIQVTPARADLPKRRTELSAKERELLARGGDLGWKDVTVPEIEGRIPSASKFREIRRLLLECSKREALLREQNGAKVEAEARLEDVHAKIDELGATLSEAQITALSAVDRNTRTEFGSILSDTSRCDRDAENALAEAVQLFQQLRPQPSSIEAASALTVPVVSSVQHHLQLRRDLDRLRAERSEAIRRAETKRSERDQEVKALVHEHGEPVSSEMLAERRNRRDRLWGLIRRKFVDGEAVPDDEVHTQLGGQANAGRTYEEAVAEADAAADTRYKQVDFSSKVRLAKKTAADASSHLNDLRNEAASLEREDENLQAAWRRVWAETGIDPLGPSEMLQWLEILDKSKQLLHDSKTAQREAKRLRQVEGRAVASICAELRDKGLRDEEVVGKPLGTVLEYLNQVVNQCRAKAVERNALHEQARELDRDVKDKREADVAAQDRFDQIHGDVAKDLRDLGLEPPDTVEGRVDQLDAFDELRKTLDEFRTLRDKRVKKIERDLESFKDTALHLGRAFDPATTEEDPERISVALTKELAASLEASREARRLDKEIAVRKSKIRNLEASRKANIARITALQAEAEATSTEELRAAIKRVDDYHRLESQRNEIHSTLLSQGDGLSVQDLVHECEGVDLDRLQADENRLESEVKEAHDHWVAARDTYREARSAFEAIDDSAAAAEAESERQSALAEMQDAAEQYARTKATARILRWAIERDRQERQGPLLKAAGRLFADLSAHSFAGLTVEYDDKDRARLCGRRPEGSNVGVKGMSDGTLDQLYLALRVAALTEHIKDAKPLPFLADDLFVNFDNDRAAAGFRVLGELAERCQVIFFTHHEHLVDVARGALPFEPNVLRMSADG